MVEAFGTEAEEVEFASEDELPEGASWDSVMVVDAGPRAGTWDMYDLPDGRVARIEIKGEES